MKIKNGSLISFMIILLILSCGCIDQPPDDNSTQPDTNTDEVNTTYNINLSKIALKKADVQMNESNGKHFTKPREHTNAAGEGKTWNVLEQYQSIFSSGLASTPKNPEKSITEVLTKLVSNKKAEEFISLKKTNLIEENGYTQIIKETIGNSSFYLVKDIPVNTSSEFAQYVCYFSYNNLIINVGGITTNSSEIFEYAKLIEGRIIEYLS